MDQLGPAWSKGALWRSDPDCSHGSERSNGAEDNQGLDCSPNEDKPHGSADKAKGLANSKPDGAGAATATATMATKTT